MMGVLALYLGPWPWRVYGCRGIARAMYPAIRQCQTTYQVDMYAQLFARGEILLQVAPTVSADMLMNTTSQ